MAEEERWREPGKPQDPSQQHLMSVQQATQMAEHLHQAGRLQEANALALQILALDPHNPYVLNLLGMIAAQSGNLPVALRIYSDLVNLAPDFADGHNNMGNTLQDMGELAAAAGCYRKAVELQPDFVQAHYNLGNVAVRMGQDRAAVSHFRAALALQPDAVPVLNNLGTALRRLGEYQQALPYLRQLCALQARDVDALNNLANTLGELGDYPLAMESLRDALQLQPDAAKTHYNIGVTLGKQGLAAQAIDAYRNALRHDPNHMEAKWNCALALLMLGDYADGWPLHEVRLCKSGAGRTALSAPRWQGENLSGKTIFVHAEQGYGDTIQFVRYLSLLSERYAAKKIILECQPELQRLLAGMPGIGQVIAGGIHAAPEFDVQIPLLSLPLIFGTRLDSIPCNIPYIAAPMQLLSKWQTSFSNETRMKIGLVWAGRPDNANDARRSIAAELLAPLVALKDICFVSLQKAAANSQGLTAPSLIDRTAELADFADTAALISQLDLIISVDTAVAHLAGAMGKQVWLLNCFESEWRWMLDRVDNAWYPGMRIFRQPESGDWVAVIRAVIAELTIISSIKSQPSFRTFE